MRRGDRVCFIVPSFKKKAVIRDYAGGLGFEANSGYILPPLGLMQLAACIENDFEVSLFDAQAAGYTANDLIGILKVNNIGLAIIELSVPTLSSDIDFARAIAGEGIRVFGKISTSRKDILARVLEGKAVSGCIVGECEDNLSDIILGTSRVGTACLEEGEVKLYPKPFIYNLNSLPFPKRDLVSSNCYSYPKLGQCTTVLSSRGCPYLCRYYCPYPLSQGENWRSRTAENVVSELSGIKKMGIDRVLFRDPVYTLSIDRVKAICEGMIRNNLDLRWWCETRATCLTDSLIEIMAKSGCIGINMGVESGDERLRLDTLKSGVRNSDLYRISLTGRKHGIKICFLLMIGFPGETKTSILRTAKLLRRCRPFGIGISFLVNHPGTQLDIDARENKWIIQDDYHLTDGSEPVMEAGSLSALEMRQGKDFLDKLFESIKQKNQEEEYMIYVNRPF